MNNLVGYTISGKHVESGTFFTYHMAGNGLWISAENEYINATIPIAGVSVRGLPPMNMFLALKHGRIPQRFWDLAYSVIIAHPDEERYIGIRWAGAGYDLYYPEQEGSGAAVKYFTGNDIVMEMHSHPTFAARFSHTDDDDEQGFKVYAVVGNIDKPKPSINLLNPFFFRQWRAPARVLLLYIAFVNCFIAFVCTDIGDRFDTVIGDRLS